MTYSLISVAHIHPKGRVALLCWYQFCHLTIRSQWAQWGTWNSQHWNQQYPTTKLNFFPSARLYEQTIFTHQSIWPTQLLTTIEWLRASHQEVWFSWKMKKAGNTRTHNIDWSIEVQQIMYLVLWLWGNGAACLTMCGFPFLSPFNRILCSMLSAAENGSSNKACRVHRLYIYICMYVDWRHCLQCWDEELHK